MPDVALVRARLDDVIEAMKVSGLWDLERPPEQAFADMGPFGQRTIGFVHWLRFVFVPQVERSIAGDGPWPRSSQVAVQAAREGDTAPPIAALVGPLSAFDALFQG